MLFDLSCCLCYFIAPSSARSSFFFFFNDTATTEIYTLSLHDALPILKRSAIDCIPACTTPETGASAKRHQAQRSEEHTSELQSPCNLVCRLLLEKKKNQFYRVTAAKGETDATPQCYIPHSADLHDHRA